jgi:protocatechuate 3,4-dioxygenase, alpha subunit
MAEAPTPSQTVGPYLHIGLIDGVLGPAAVPADRPGAVMIRGRVLDGAGAPVPDGMVEAWGAGADGRYDGPDYRGFARSGTVAGGAFELVVLKPGRVAAPDGRLQAPHLAIGVFARGLVKRLATRLYFPDEAAANGEDPVLALLTAAERSTLVATPDGEGLRFDIRLQGPGQTTFFAV